MPLEALRYDVTPIGLHYLLIHFDIPTPGRDHLVPDNVWRGRAAAGAGPRRYPRHSAPNRSRDARVRRERPRQIDSASSQRTLARRGGRYCRADGHATPAAAGVGRVSADAVEVLFPGAEYGFQGEVENNYARRLTLADAGRQEVLFAYEMNGEPLQPQHGYPLLRIVPGSCGMASVKWLTSIGARRESLAGFQQGIAYRHQRDEDDPGLSVNRIRVRALMVPPGIPDFFTRRRVVDRRRVELSGRAWWGNGSSDVSK